MDREQSRAGMGMDGLLGSENCVCVKSQDRTGQDKTLDADARGRSYARAQVGKNTVESVGEGRVLGLLVCKTPELYSVCLMDNQWGGFRRGRMPLRNPTM